MAKVLTDKELLAALTAGGIKLEVRDQAPGAYRSIDLARQSPLKNSNTIQPSSIDLCIGRIFHPPISPFASTVQDAPFQSGGQLEPGHTVVVETAEKITLASNYGAFGFPPSRVSKNAILTTNPGHVDPGFSGHLSFTLINMGREPFNLLADTPIVTLLVFELSSDVEADYQARKNASSSGGVSPFVAVLNRLAPDFGSFTRRMQDAAKEAVSLKSAEFEARVVSAESRLDLRKLWLPALLGLLGAAVAYSGTALNYAQDDDLEALQTRVIALEKQGNLTNLEARVSALEAEQPNE